MRTLVIYYSRTGTTRKVAELITGMLEADSEQVKDKKKRSGFFGYLGSGFDAVFKKTTTIETIKKNPASYELIIIGTPSWGAALTPAIRTYISQNKNKIKYTAFFVTQGGSGGKKLLRSMEELCGKKPLATFIINEAEVKESRNPEKVKAFVDKISNL